MSEKTKELLFVYGTLRRGGLPAMQALLQQHSAYLGMARVMGQLYLVAGYPGLTLDQPAYPVLGELYRLTEPDLIWPLLDQYEGVGPGYSEPCEYVKQPIKVWGDDGQEYWATSYLYNRTVQHLPLIRSGDFFAP